MNVPLELSALTTLNNILIGGRCWVNFGLQTYHGPVWNGTCRKHHGNGRSCFSHLRSVDLWPLGAGLLLTDYTANVEFMGSFSGNLCWAAASCLLDSNSESCFVWRSGDSVNSTCFPRGLWEGHRPSSVLCTIQIFVQKIIIDQSS